MDKRANQWLREDYYQDYLWKEDLDDILERKTRLTFQAYMQGNYSLNRGPMIPGRINLGWIGGTTRRI